ncbi:MAG TPA: PAAR domain-containing protein [Herpetosiphonaceae bacterium]
MPQPAAKQGDTIVAIDIHLIQPPGPSSPVPVPHPFNGIIDNSLSQNVKIEGRPAATVTSTATNTPPHIPIGGTFVKPPSNQARIIRGSATVFINNKPAARAGDTALTCNDPADLPVGTVVAISTVLIGG